MSKHLLYFILLIFPFILIGQNKSNSSQENIVIPFDKSFKNSQNDDSGFYSSSINEECFQQYTGDYFGALWMSYNWSVANDLNVEANTQLTVETLEFEVINIEGLPTTFNIEFYKDNMGAGPGTPVGELQSEIVPFSITPNGTWGTSGYQIYKIIIVLPEPLTLQATSTEDSKYWFALSAAQTTEESFFIYLASSRYTENESSRPTWISDGGIWLEYVDAGNKAEGIIKITGDCDALQGCTDAPNGQFPAKTFVPSCNGFTESITSGVTALTGQYSTVQVNNGINYTFSSSESKDFVTITDENDSTLAVGTGSISWISNFDGEIRFYTHLDGGCSSDNQHTRERRVLCGVPECDEQKVLSNDFSSATTLGSWFDQHLAFDIPVGETGFTLYGIELNILRNINNTNHDSDFNIGFYNTVNGVPGILVQRAVITIHEEEVIGTFISNLGQTYDIYKYILRFENPVNLDGTSKYWMVLDPIEEDILWETNPTSILGSGYALKNLSTGFNWAVNPDSEVVYNLICDEILNVNDMNSAEFSFYPNPAKNILNIISEKRIERLEAYNFNGQAVLIKEKAVNKQIDIQSLSAGIYLFKITLEGGQVETFKVLKN